MPTISVQIKGLDELARALQRLAQRAPAQAGRLLVRQAEGIMGTAKALCPVDTGALRASGHVQAPVVDGSRISVTLGFGGPAAPYAVYVHENLTAHHPVGQAKFLERAVLDALPALRSEIAADFAELFAGAA